MTERPHDRTSWLGRGGRTVRPGEPVDDPLVVDAVRSLAESWTMPPRRSGGLTWQDRVEGRAGGSGVGTLPGRWARRSVRAASAAAAATVVLALVAAWLSVPRSTAPGPAASGGAPNGGAGLSPGPSGLDLRTDAPRPAQTPAPTPSPFPQLLLSGGLPETRLLVTAGPGYQVVDFSRLDRAATAPTIPWEAATSEPVVLGDGRLLCLCASRSVAPGGGERVALELLTIRADGAVEQRQPVGTYVSSAGSSPIGGAPPARSVLTPDGGRFVVGWTVRAAGAWRSGIDLVDIATGRLTAAGGLPDLPLAADGTVGGGSGQPAPSAGEPVAPWAPEIRVSPDGRRLLITRQVTIGDRVAATERFSARLEGGRLAGLLPLASGPGSLGDPACTFPVDERFVTNELYAATCTDGSRSFLRRVTADGAPVGDTDLGALTGGTGLFLGANVAIDAADRTAYYWGAFARTVMKVDLANGRILASATLPVTAAAPTGAADDPLALAQRALATWLAPSVAAKLYFEPGIALSPDRSRLYLVGTKAQSFDDLAAGSDGIWVLDTGTLAVVDRWPPTADFVSVAVSNDGRWVYAAGLPGVGPDGQDGPYEASITVFDATDGRVRALAGQLGRDVVSIRAAIVP